MMRTAQAEADRASDGSPAGAAGPAGSERGGDAQPSAVDVTLGRLEDQIAWYSKRAKRSQWRFKVVKLAELALAASLPVWAVFGLGWGTQATAVTGMLIVVLQGFEQLFQDQQNWITYRSTCEQLKHEKYLFHAGAGPYASATQPVRRLADRIEGLISQEHSKWVDNREEAAEQLQNVEASA